MKCDELKAYGMADPAIDDEYEMYKVAEVDEAIVELKEKLHDVDNQWNEQCKEIAQLKARLVVLQSFYDLHGNVDNYIDKLKAENEQLKAKLESVQASVYAESVDAGMRERRQRRALWLARAELCRRLDVDRYLRKHRNSWYNENCLTWAAAFVAMAEKVCKAESKCRAKAEEYK